MKLAMMQSTKMEANRLIYVGALTMIFDGAKVQSFSVIAWLLFGYYLFFVRKAFAVNLRKFDIFFVWNVRKLINTTMIWLIYSTPWMLTMARSAEKSLLMMSLHVLLFYLLDVGRDCLVHFSPQTAVVALPCSGGLWGSSPVGLFRDNQKSWTILSELSGLLIYTTFYPSFLYPFLPYENLVSAKLSCNFAPDNQLNQHNCELI